MQLKHERLEYFCDKCDFKAKYKQVLKKHVRIVREGGKYCCNICESKYTKIHALNRHIKNAHIAANIQYQPGGKVGLRGLYKVKRGELIVTDEDFPELFVVCEPHQYSCNHNIIYSKKTGMSN